MEKLHYLHFAHITGNVVDALYIFDPEPINLVDDDESGAVFLSESTGLDRASLINIFVGGTPKGVYPEVGYTYDPETDTFHA